MPDNPASISPGDSQYLNQVSLRDRAQANWVYFHQHPDEVIKYGLDPKMFTTPQEAATQQQQIEGSTQEAEPTNFATNIIGEGVQRLAAGLGASPSTAKEIGRVVAHPTLGVQDAVEAEAKARGLSPELSHGIGVAAGMAAPLLFPGAAPEAAEAEAPEAAEGAATAASDVGPAATVAETPKPIESTPAKPPVSPSGEIQATNETQTASGINEVPADDFLSKLQKIVGEDTEAQRRGVRPYAATQAAADSTDVGSLTRVLPPGTALNAEQNVALQNFVAGKGKEIQDVAERILSEPDGAKQLQMIEDEFKPAVLAFGEFNKYAEGGQAEAGRALGAFNLARDANASRSQLANTLKNMTPENAMDYVRTIASMKTPEQAAEVVINSTKNGGASTFGDGLLKYAVNAALSSPVLPAKKVMTDMVSNVGKIAAYAIGSRVNPADIPPGMATAAVRGMAEGTGDALRAGYGALKEGKPIWSIANDSRGIFGSDALEGTAAGKFLDYTGALSAPSRLIMGLGEFQKALSYRMELRALAWKQAMDAAKESVGSDPLDAPKMMEQAEQIYGSLMRTIPPNLHARALQEMDLNSFLKEPGTVGQHIQSIANNFNPGGIPLGRLGLLFYRTPLNLIKAEMHYSPIGLMGALKDMARHGVGEANTLSAAKGALGTMITAMAVYGHHMGYLTGNGPGNPELRKAWDLNHRPYSIKGPDGKWYGYNNIPLFRASVAFAADLADMYPRMPKHDAVSLAAMTAQAVARNVEHMPFMNLITDFADYLTQSMQGETGAFARNAGDFLSRLAIPSGVSAIARADDPIHRQTRSFLDEWREKIPGLSKTLPPDRNAFGEPWFIPGGYTPEDAPGYGMRAYNFLSPLPVSNNMEEHDPLFAELEHVGANLTPPPRAIGGQAPPQSAFAEPSLKSGVALTPQQYDRLQVLAGEGKYEEMERLIHSPFYKGASDIQKKLALEGINKAFNQVGRARLMAEDPSILAALTQQREDMIRQGVSRVSVATP